MTSGRRSHPELEGDGGVEARQKAGNGDVAASIAENPPVAMTQEAQALGRRTGRFANAMGELLAERSGYPALMRSSLEYVVDVVVDSSLQRGRIAAPYRGLATECVPMAEAEHMLVSDSRTGVADRSCRPEVAAATLAAGKGPEGPAAKLAADTGLEAAVAILAGGIGLAAAQDLDILEAGHSV